MPLYVLTVLSCAIIINYSLFIIGARLGRQFSIPHPGCGKPAPPFPLRNPVS
ncbi:hypothetical protein NIES39_D03580 [Arthrospira platensis NIES-39]|nr:hypothetical protein NIES39_D03580 [Arthrospira platensis NIES-39]